MMSQPFSPLLFSCCLGRLVAVLGWLLVSVPIYVKAESDSLTDWAWWPAQVLPKGLTEVPQSLYERGPDVGADRKAQTVLIESLAGLAAQAVNENRGDELVWVDPGGSSAGYGQWLADFKARTKIEDRGSLSPWDLAARLTKAGLVKGYILYQPDPSVEKKLADRKTIDRSLNVATTAAGVLGGILIVPAMEDRAKALGLALLLDARGKSEAWAFNQFKDKLNRRYLLLQDPRLAQNRDLAIAHRIAALYTIESPYPEILSWMEPLGTVFGWYGDSEDKSVGLASKAAQVVVASDYTRNLPLLSAGRAGFNLPAPASAPIDSARIEKAARRTRAGLHAQRWR